MAMNLVLSPIDLPVRLTPPAPLNDEQLLEFCALNEGVRVERNAHGELIVMSAATSKTSGRNMDLCTELNNWAHADGRGKAFDSSGGFTLPDGSMRNPDAAWILYSRWDALSEEEQDSFAPLCPDFVIELCSPSDRLPDVQEKMGMWLANGVKVGWLIDPKRRVVEVYRPGKETEVHQDPASVRGDEPVRGFELVLERVW